jgi:hypothetical protein
VAEGGSDSAEGGGAGSAEEGGAGGAEGSAEGVEEGTADGVGEQGIGGATDESGGCAMGDAGITGEFSWCRTCKDVGCAVGIGASAMTGEGFCGVLGLGVLLDRSSVG